MIDNLHTSDEAAGESPEFDVVVLTSTGARIPARSHSLAMASPVLEKLLETPDVDEKTGESVIPIAGVPSEAVFAFIRFLYTSSSTDEDMDKYGIHLLALSHLFSVPKLKQRCTKELAVRLTIENVIDVLQLSRLCDAPDLYVKCMKLVTTKFNIVEKTEAWKFIQKHDPWLELDILQFIEEIESRKKRRKKQKESQSVYLQLSEAMECLVHICTEGCTSVGPSDMEPSKKKEPCSRFSTCQGLQLLIKHFATCNKRVNAGCSRCKRMWQLLKLHSSICDHPIHCRVPLCRQFNLKMQQERKADDGKWKLLVKKVILAKTISSLSWPECKTAPPKQVRGFRTLHSEASNFQGMVQCP